MDLENLGSAPDIENFDPSTMDRGDLIEAPKVDEPVEEPVEDKVEDKEPEPEETPEEEPEAKDEEPEEKPRDEKGRFEAKIPKSRFDEAVGKEREAREAAERRAAELERQLQAQEQQQAQTAQVEEIEAKITELEAKHAELLLDGNSKEAASVMKQIRHAERQIARAEADAVANTRTAQALETERVNVTIARLQADHPILNENSEDYNVKAVRYVLSEQRRLMAEEGMSPSVALEQAGKDAMEIFAPKEAAPKADEGLAAAKIAADRKAAQLAKNIDTAKKQPASMKEAGIDSDKAGKTSEVDIMSMSADEFAALPEATKAKLRGDYV